mgnify:FL=1
MTHLIDYLADLLYERRLKRAIAKANNMHEITGHVYMVLMIKGRLVVKAKKNLKQLIKMHKLNCKITTLEEAALYITPKQ